VADTAPTSSLEVIKFRRDFFREYVRNNRLSSYTGTGITNPIVIKEDRGPTVRHPLVTRMQGSGVSGSDSLRGNGEAIGNYSWDTNPTYYRHAAEFNKEDLEKTNIALMRAARPLLMEWAMAATRDRQLQAMGAIYNGTTYSTYADAAEAAKDTWQTNNSDRVLYGSVTTNASGDDSADLAKVDSTNDKLTGDVVSLLRRLAEDADPHIRPIQTDQESEVYVLFAGSVGFRDLKANLQTINSNADVRGMRITRGGNILARDGDMFWDGVIIRKVPEITKIFSATGKPLATAGASSIAVEPAFLCGAQALVHGLGQRPNIVVDRTYDYGFKPGVAVELKEDVKKAYFNSVQHGMVTGYVSGAA
jgi:hypothetical protein